MKKVEATQGKIVALFPAFRPTLKKETVALSPVWAARLANGEVIIVADSGPAATAFRGANR
jgi:hypothetical protein